MADRYKLLKDIPGVKTGTIFEFSFDRNWSHYVGLDKTGKDAEYDQSIVENETDFFQKIVDNQIIVKYTESDLKQARIDAFNAARSKEIVPMETPMNKYTSAEDYLQSLSNK